MGVRLRRAKFNTENIADLRVLLHKTSRMKVFSGEAFGGLDTLNLRAMHWMRKCETPRTTPRTKETFKQSFELKSCFNEELVGECFVGMATSAIPES